MQKSHLSVFVSFSLYFCWVFSPFHVWKDTKLMLWFLFICPIKVTTKRITENKSDPLLITASKPNQKQNGTIYHKYKVLVPLITKICYGVYLLQSNFVLWEMYDRFSDLVSKWWMSVYNLYTDIKLANDTPKHPVTCFSECWSSGKAWRLTLLLTEVEGGAPHVCSPTHENQNVLCNNLYLD